MSPFYGTLNMIGYTCVRVSWRKMEVIQMAKAAAKPKKEVSMEEALWKSADSLGVQPPIPREKGADTIREKIYEYP